MAAFYVATKFENKEKAAALMAKLEHMGHTISHKWVYQKEAYTVDAPEQAELDYLGVMRCDVLVLLFDKHFEYLNAYVELGIALGAGKTIYVIGEHDERCIFSKMPAIMRFKTTRQFLELAQRMPRSRQ